MVRGVEEEVFETPDQVEDDPLEAGMLPEWTTAKESPISVKEVPNGEVLPTLIPPRAAFEVFMGKTYAGAREDMSDVIGTSSVGPEGAAVYSAEGFHREGVYSGEGTGMGVNDASRRRAGESPAQRLVRLREETAILADDLEEMSKAWSGRQAGGGEEGEDDGASAAGGNVGSGGYALWTAMAKETEALRRQLAELSGDPKYKPTGTAEAKEALQRRLSEGIIKALEALRDRDAAGGTTTATEDTGSPGGDAAEKSQTNSDSITFELYLKEAAEVRARTRASGVTQHQLKGAGDLSAVESRIAALEKALGDGGRLEVTGIGFGERSQGAPLADAVASLEKRVAVLEPDRLDALRQKAQLAKAELDGLAKSRGSVPASTVRGGASQRKIEEAFTTLQSWQAVSAGLPALVDRLRALETLHLASASFAQRLEQLEGCQSELVGVLKSTNEELVATRESSAENVAIVEENIRTLDTRLVGIGLS